LTQTPDKIHFANTVCSYILKCGSSGFPNTFDSNWKTEIQYLPRFTF